LKHQSFNHLVLSKFRECERTRRRRR